MKVEEYAERIQQEAIALADVEEGGGLRLDAFTQLVGQRLVEAGEFDEFEVAYHKARGVEVGGWSLAEDGEVLHLVVADYRGSGLEALTPTNISASFKRLVAFVERSLGDYADSLEESSPAFELADLVRGQWKALRSARLYLFSDARAKRPEYKPVEIAGVPVSFHIWDLERLFRLDTSGLEREPIVVDVVERLGYPLQCLPGPSAVDHDVYLLLLPATLLADLYNEYAGRLLERNVRSFLQARGTVNRGIRDTILNAPDRFLAYNNGISATSSEVDIERHEDGRVAIRAIHDLQVVNGGQTTASLASAVKRDAADVRGIFVQAKLTVVADDKIDELVAHISQYSNTQNKVTGADFSANDPFHVKVEELSRSVWAPAADGTQRQTHWFYERARGQYVDEQARARTEAKRRQFKALNPPSQKFSKTDLAKFEHSWEQLPWLVSLGAEKNFREFMLRLEERRITPDNAYFERLVGKAILFRSTEKLVSAFKFGGYRANIVTYSIAKLSNVTAHRVDLSAIWRNQEISAETANALCEIIPLVHDVIVRPAGRVRHVGEWCKKKDCWAAVTELDWAPKAGLKSELLALKGDGPADARDLGLGTPTTDEVELVAAAKLIPGDEWFRLSNWAKETGNLQAWQRGLAYSLGRVAGQEREPSVKQSRQGLKMLEEAKRLGFM
jgi:hypothetical protein